MSARPEVLHAVRRWVEKAEEDLRAAERLLELREGFDSVICFHAHQSSEKYLKALLTLHSIAFPETHDLLAVLGLVPERLGIGLGFSDVAALNRYAVEARYPADWEPLTEEDTNGALSTARRVRDAVTRMLLQDVSESGS